MKVVWNGPLRVAGNGKSLTCKVCVAWVKPLEAITVMVGADVKTCPPLITRFWPGDGFHAAMPLKVAVPSPLSVNVIPGGSIGKDREHIEGWQAPGCRVNLGAG